MWLEKGPFLERWNLLFWNHVKESDSFVHFSTRRQLVMVIQIPRVWCAKSWRRNGSHESRCCFVPCMEMGRYGKIIHSTEIIWNLFRQNSYDLAIWLCSKAGQLSAETSRIFCDSPSGHCYWKGGSPCHHPRTTRQIKKAPHPIVPGIGLAMLLGLWVDHLNFAANL